MANKNPQGSAKFWFEGEAASSIDNGAPNAARDATNNWVGGTNYWYQGTPQGFLQGGVGKVGESPENIFLIQTRPIAPPTSIRTRAYATII